MSQQQQSSSSLLLLEDEVVAANPCKFKTCAVIAFEEGPKESWIVSRRRRDAMRSLFQRFQGRYSRYTLGVSEEKCVVECGVCTINEGTFCWDDVRTSTQMAPHVYVVVDCSWVLLELPVLQILLPVLLLLHGSIGSNVGREVLATRMTTCATYVCYHSYDMSIHSPYSSGTQM